MSAARPRVFTVPGGAPFLAVLADSVLAGRLGSFDRADPLALADVTILLPTRRAVRALREAFVARLGGTAILPRIRPIGDVDEEDHLLAAVAETGAERLVLPPGIPPLDRQLVLTRLTLAWGRAVRRELLAIGPDEPILIPASAADATRLAADLGRLIDDLAIAGIGFDAVKALAPEDHARYFQITLDFLKVAAERWPEFLAEKGLVDPAARRDHLIRAEAERLRISPPAAPVIAAGSTGSIPATAELLKAIAGLPNGAVVLPGLDQTLDAAAWNAIGEGGTGAAAWTHPQFGLKQLIGEIGILREDVVALGRPARAVRVRGRLVAEALRPAETTETWAGFTATEATPRAVRAALAGVDLLVARNEQEEALAIAIAVREAVETQGTVAVVTPDRTLARRVAAELGRWGLAVDDSAGAPLSLTPAGVFARLLVEAVAGEGEPVKLLALLKHPFAAFGMERFECRRAARMLEIALFRGRRVPGGIAALSKALAESRRAVEERAPHQPWARRRLQPGDWNAAATLVEAVGNALGHVESQFVKHTEAAASTMSALLLDALANASRDDTGADDRLWQGSGGEALATLLLGIAGSGESLTFPPGDFPGFLTALMDGVAVTRPASADPRIHIWGALEARLQSVDLLVLAGLDEGVWPAATRTDPWLSRTMRAEIGLPPPERRTGQAAHDFALAFLAPRVIVSRAAKRDGTPTVASRWLQRLGALIGGDAAAAAAARGARYVELARGLDSTTIPKPIRRPKPTPPVAVRPRNLSITEVETFIRDPYAIYARHVLRLDELDPPGRAPDYALRGSLIHEALGKFTAEWTGPFDRTAEARLIAIGRETLAEIEAFPDVHALWWIRFAAIAGWVIGWERERANLIAERHAEIDGRLDLPAPAGPFTLRGRADRIDLRHDGALEILDYKSGSPPTAKQVLVGFNPQLGLEAGMVQAGAFKPEFAGHNIANLSWIGLSRVDRGKPLKSAVEQGQTADGVGEKSMELFRALIAAFDSENWPFVSRARPMFEQRYESPYDHLARVREWGLVESDEDLQLWFAPPKP